MHFGKSAYFFRPKRTYNFFKKHNKKGNGFEYGIVTRNKVDTSRTLSARYYKDGSEILISQEDLKTKPNIRGRPRKLMPEECARLMGISSAKNKFNIQCSIPKHTNNLEIQL